MAQPWRASVTETASKMEDILRNLDNSSSRVKPAPSSAPHSFLNSSNITPGFKSVSAPKTKATSLSINTNISHSPKFNQQPSPKSFSSSISQPSPTGFSSKAYSSGNNAPQSSTSSNSKPKNAEVSKISYSSPKTMAPKISPKPAPGYQIPEQKSTFDFGKKDRYMPYDTRNSTSSTSQSTPKTPTFPPPPPELTEKKAHEPNDKKTQKENHDRILEVTTPKNSFQLRNIDDEIDNLESLNENFSSTSGNKPSQPSMETKFITADNSPTKKPSEFYNLYNKDKPKTTTEDELNNAMKRLTAGVQKPSENKVLETKCCGRCDKQILDPVVASVFNQTFHVDCFTCTSCDKTLHTGVEFYVIGDNQPTCNDCYKMKLKRCKKCGKFIEAGRIIKALGFEYHPECFCCKNCGKMLDGEQFTSNREQDPDNPEPFCIPCYGELYAEKCYRCVLPIVGAEKGMNRITVENTHYHEQCFECFNEDCCVALTTGAYPVIINDQKQLFCKDHALEMTKKLKHR